MERDQQTSSTPRTPNGTEPTVVLKKYGNRRLYDTTASRYVTLVEVEAMVQQGTDIQVVDARSGEDITREVLVQLLLERDSARASLPTGLLKQAVRLANSPLKEGLVKAMQEGLDTFMSGQRAMADAQRALTSSLTPWLSSTTTPVPLWNPFPPPPPPGAAAAPAAPAAPATSSPSSSSSSSSPSELDALRAELGQTQALVRQLLERELARTAHEASSSSSSSSATGAAPAASAAPAAKKPTARKKKS